MSPQTKIAIIHLAPIGPEMARSLLGAGPEAIGCDPSEAAPSRFDAAGGKVLASPGGRRQ